MSRLKGELEMYKRNDGSGVVNTLQNQFTAYLTKSVRNARSQYIRNRARLNEKERPMEDEACFLLIVKEPVEISALSETEELLAALKSIKDRERRVFLARVLDEKPFEEIAAELGMSYKGAAAVYYRTIAKLRKRLEEEE